MDEHTSEMKTSAAFRMVADYATSVEKGNSTGRMRKVYLNKTHGNISKPYCDSVFKLPNFIVEAPLDIDLPSSDRKESDELDKVKTYFVTKPGSGANSCDIRHDGKSEESCHETSQKSISRPSEQENTHSPEAAEMENKEISEMSSCSVNNRPADTILVTRVENGTRGKSIQVDKGFENYRTNIFCQEGIQSNGVTVRNSSEFPRKRKKPKIQPVPLVDKLKRPEHKVLGFMEDHIEYNSIDNVVGLEASSTKRATVLESTLDGTLIVGARRTNGARMKIEALDDVINCEVDSKECTTDPLVTMDKWGLKSESHRYKCSNCEVSGQSKKVVEEHLKEHHGEENDAVVVVLLGGFAGGRLCPFCHQRLKRKFFFKHVRQEHLEKFPYRCGFCNFLGQDRNQICHHIRNKHKTYDYQVVDALETVREMEDKDKLYEHSEDLQMENIKSPPSLICPICSKVFKAFPYVKKHLQQHKKQRFKCNYCFFVSPCKAQMQTHFKRKHNEYDPSWDLVTARCSGNKVLVDDVGPYLQQLIEEYGMHKPKADKRWVRQYSCPHCEYTCRFNSSFNRHLRIHEGSKRYKCKYCSFRAREAYTIRKHCGIKHKGLTVEIEYDEHYKAPYRYAKKDQELVNKNKVSKAQAAANAPSNNPEVTTSASVSFTGITLASESTKDGKHNNGFGERTHKGTQAIETCAKNKMSCDKDQDGNSQKKSMYSISSENLADMTTPQLRKDVDVDSTKELSERNNHVEQDTRIQRNENGLCLKNSSNKCKVVSCEMEKQNRKYVYSHVNNSLGGVEKGEVEKKREDALSDIITLGTFDEQEILPKLSVIEVDTPEQGQATGKMWIVDDGEEKVIKRKRKRVKDKKYEEEGKGDYKKGRREKKDDEEKEKNEENSVSHEDIMHNQINNLNDSVAPRSGNRISSTPGVMTRDLLGLDYRNLEYFSPEMVRAMRGESDEPDSDRVVCKVCRVSTTKRAFYKHAKKHFHVKPFKCGHCNYRSIEKSKIRVHNTFCHPDLSCVIEKLNPKTAMMPVEQIIHNQLRTTVQTSQESVDEEALWCVIVETGQNMWWCHTCSVDVCGGEEEVQAHVTARNDYLSLLAAANATQQTRPQNNKQHQASTQNVFECPLCQKTLRAHTTSVRRHLYAHYGYKPYCCGYCSYTALCPGEVKQHNVSHRQQRPPLFVPSGAVMPSELQHFLSIYCSPGPSTQGKVGAQPKNTAPSKRSTNAKDQSTFVLKGRGEGLNKREKEAWPCHSETMLKQSKLKEEHEEMSEETTNYQSTHSILKITQQRLPQTFPLQLQRRLNVRSECEREEEEENLDLQDKGAVRGTHDLEGDGASITLYALEDYEDSALLGHPSTLNPFPLLHTPTRMDDLAFICLS